MKNALLVILAVSTALTCYSQNFSIPDPNFEQALIDLNLDNTSPTDEIDGMMSFSIAADVTELNISNKNISDLSGIENFTSLEILFVENNNLTEANFSSNLALQRLTIFNNNLTALNLSNHSSLERLFCQSNQITSLILPTSSSSLQRLECQFNNLTTIDLSNSVVLDDIKMQHNNFSFIDFSNKPLLKDIDAFNNQLTSINLDNCDLLEDIDFRNNQITSLELIDRPNLLKIFLDFNNLSSLTVKNVRSSAWNFNITLLNNPNLTCVAVSDPIESENEWLNVDSQVFFSTDCDAAPIAIPDPNFEQALIDLGIDTDGVVNGEMAASDAAGITDLDVSSQNISDLTGIEGFINLESLLAINNNLTSIDLSQNNQLDTVVFAFNDLTSIDFSNNPNLTFLNIQNNNLVSVDFSNNTSLTQIFLESNSLTGIDVSMLTNLEDLDVSSNSVSELDVSLNTNLINLFCNANQLESLNVKNGNNTSFESFEAQDNALLDCIKVDDVSFSTANWLNSEPQFNFDDGVSFDLECLDVISIPDPNFEQALIDLSIDSDGLVNGQILESDALGVTDLDVNSYNISDLSGIEFFVDLEVLTAFNNNLMNVDLSQNLQLTTLLLALNNLSSIDLSNHPNLLTLSLNNNNLTSLDISANLNLVQLFVNDNGLNSLDVSTLSNLENLGVANNSLTDLNMSLNSSLISLFCNDNQLQNLNLQNGNNTVLVEVHAENNSLLTCIQIDDIAFSNTNWLNAQPQYSFDNQAFFSTDCTNLIDIPDPNFEQALIDLNIDTDGLVNGVMSLSNATGVTLINANNKNIQSLQGIEFFTDLETLSAFNNNLSTIDLSGNPNLNALTLFGNTLGNLDLTNNTNLTFLSVGFNLLTQIDLSANSQLEEVLIENNLLNEIDVTVLPSLWDLNVGGNALTQLNLNQNTLLTALDCSNNNLINLKIQNGNNAFIQGDDFDVTNNSNLTCIEVDDVNYSFANWFNKDPQTLYALDCTIDNDDCIDALTLLLGVDFNSTTQSSTPSGLDPGCQQSGIVLFDVWFRFTAPASGSVTVFLDAAQFNPKVAVYEDCNAVTPIACGINGIQLDNLVDGEFYYLQIWVEGSIGGRSANTVVGDFNIEVVDSATLSIDDNQLNSEVKLFPNPAHSDVNIEAHSSIDNITLFDITGKEILTVKSINKSHYNIDLQGLSKGVYLIQIQSQNRIINKSY